MFNRSISRFYCSRIGLSLACTAVAVVGCSTKPLEYRENLLHAASLQQGESPDAVQQLAASAKQQVEEVLGTLDEPKWPDGIANPLDWAKVMRSAGPVGRDHTKIERGLYRKHCVQCHGLTGDGMGPAASLLAPYPRDFRRGTFKFKSTPIGKKPTHADIVRTIQEGIPGTSMPAFGSLNHTKEFAEDVDAMAHYVRFLAIRGEVERRCIQAQANDDQADTIVLEELKRVAQGWSDADSHVVVPPTCGEPETDAQRMESAKRGGVLFQSELTACVKCHGPEARGDGTSKDFDDWTKDWTIRAGINPESKQEWKTQKKFGALKPVIDPARNLHLGVFRGGATRKDIAMRLILGIEGSPMPPIARSQNGNPGLTDAELCDLVEYVYGLSRSSASPLPTSEVKHASGE
jgi:mono/diheme cytochrome c family protein